MMVTGEEEQGHKLRYTYRECFAGSFEHPCGRVEAVVFDMLFAAAMATTMILTVNLGIRPAVMGVSESFSAVLLRSAEMLPLLFAIAVMARLVYADRLSMWLFSKLVAPYMSGVAASSLLVTINVALMAPLMCACAVLLSGAPVSAIPFAFTSVLPYAACAGFVIAMILIRPLVMLAFSNLYVPWHRKANHAEH